MLLEPEQRQELLLAKLRRRVPVQHNRECRKVQHILVAEPHNLAAEQRNAEHKDRTSV